MTASDWWWLAFIVVLAVGILVLVWKGRG